MALVARSLCFNSEAEMLSAMQAWPLDMEHDALLC
eukprot:CAMPEP_0170622436 /NCGR_PEP_ID=MMETSP0224-20130122/29131_1 /TAXON_ID=285029 /ORGANISM="Togula jolla, Strain CCCM 725" /LENGTH=34 /DNA_ID= /DNA_START= /DNA_END= /DNA_ORIENTATION=